MSHTHEAESNRRGLLHWFVVAAALVLTVLLRVVAYPPFDVAEAAYVLAVPLLLWATARPHWRHYLIGVFAANALSWSLLLIWLRHMEPPMGWVALVVLSGILGLFGVAWFGVARWLFPAAMERSTRPRLISLLGLAGWWIVLEWVRSWVLYGFPWATLAVSQWQRPPMLPVAAWTGAYGVSFILIFFNLALATYAWRLLHPTPDLAEDGADAENSERGDEEAEAESSDERPVGGPTTGHAGSTDDAGDDNDSQERPYRSLSRSLLHAPSQRPMTNALSLSGAFTMARTPGGSFTRFLRISPELYLALFMVLGSLWLFFKTLPRGEESAPFFDAAVVQPWTAPNKKWDANFFRENLLTLSSLTERAAVTNPDLIVWPEAATPGPLLDPKDARMRIWVEQLVSSVGTPLVSGNLAIDDGHWYNGVFVVYPGTGTFDTWYAKQKRVPFGEFVPFRKLLPFLGKFVPVEDIARGPGPIDLPIDLGNETVTAGPLICYEDIFPKLARQVTAGGADFLLVVTNDAWYGQEAGAIQHAAHSVLRAVETRRPVLRCGNNGWSGWIDEQGRIRDVLLGLDDSVYFQGTGTFQLRRDLRWVDRLTPYVRYGDWFVGLSGLLFAWACLRERSGHTLNSRA